MLLGSSSRSIKVIMFQLIGQCKQSRSQSETRPQIESVVGRPTVQEADGYRAYERILSDLKVKMLVYQTTTTTCKHGSKCVPTSWYCLLRAPNLTPSVFRPRKRAERVDMLRVKGDFPVWNGLCVQTPPQWRARKYVAGWPNPCA